MSSSLPRSCLTLDLRVQLAKDGGAIQHDLIDTQGKDEPVERMTPIQSTHRERCAGLFGLGGVTA